MSRTTLATEPPIIVDELSDATPSKSQKKRDMLELQEFGKKLVAQKRERLEQVLMPDNLREAIYAAQRIHAHEGLRRQMQYIGRLMRSVDAAPIRAMLASWEGKSKAETRWLHEIERWRNQLLANDSALTELTTRYPAMQEAITLQQLRTTIRQARKEHSQQQPSKHYRELFQQLKAIIDSA